MDDKNRAQAQALETALSDPSAIQMTKALETALQTTQMIFCARPEAALALDCLIALTVFALANPVKAECAMLPGDFAGLINTLSAASVDVMAERRRQIVVEGHLPAQDDGYDDDVLARAAASYAVPGLAYAALGDDIVWPFLPAYFNPKNRRQDLVRAAALLLAEIERLDRASAAFSESAAA